MKAFTDKLVAMGPMGLFLLALLDGIGVPLPGGVDFLLVFLSAAKPDQSWLLALVAILGSVTGGVILFRIAQKGGEMFLAKRTSTERGRRFRAWFQQYGLLTVFIPAFAIVPMPLKPFVVCAGALGVRWRPFLLTLLAARVPRYCALAYLGSHYGKEAWPWLKSHGWQMGVGALALFVALFLVVRKLGPDRRAISPARA